MANEKKVQKIYYDMLSPDGFSIRIGVPLFKTIKERNAYFKKWKARYARQGYYSSNKGDVPLYLLEDYCLKIKVDKTGTPI